MRNGQKVRITDIGETGKVSGTEWVLGDKGDDWSEETVIVSLDDHPIDIAVNPQLLEKIKD